MIIFTLCKNKYTIVYIVFSYLLKTLVKIVLHMFNDYKDNEKKNINYIP